MLDFAGSSPQRRGNINAVAPMTHSASFFAIKILTDPAIPANAGTFRPVEMRIPEGSFLDAQPPAAVCAGNTETTQRIADTVLKVFAQFAPDAHAGGEPGHDEPDRRRRPRSAQRPRLHLYRDDRRRPGRPARAATAWTASNAT